MRPCLVGLRMLKYYLKLWISLPFHHYHTGDDLSKTKFFHSSTKDPRRSVVMSESGIKRRRLVYSCSECKRKKLKCGRQLPICSRCADVGHPERCEYDPRFTMGMESDLAETGGNDQTCSQDRAAPGVDDANFGVPLSED